MSTEPTPGALRAVDLMTSGLGKTVSEQFRTALALKVDEETHTKELLASLQKVADHSLDGAMRTLALCALAKFKRAAS